MKLLPFYLFIYIFFLRFNTVLVLLNQEDFGDYIENKKKNPANAANLRAMLYENLDSSWMVE